MNVNYRSMIRRVERTRPISLNDYGFQDRHVYQDKINTLENAKKRKGITKQEIDAINLELGELYAKLETLDQEDACRREGDTPAHVTIDNDDSFPTILDYAISELAKNNHLNGLCSHEKMISIRNHLREGD